MALTLGLTKPGDAPAPKLSLNLRKGERFTVELFWDSPHDLDAHAFLAFNSGDGAKVSRLENILSTYNVWRQNKPEGVIKANPDKTFGTPCGSLLHSGDSLTGVNKDIDETITIDGSKIPADVNEIPIFVMIHAEAAPATFAQVKHAGIRIKDSGGKMLAEYELSTEFAQFNGVQMGSLFLGDKGWEFSAMGVGFSGDFNGILGQFS